MRHVPAFALAALLFIDSCEKVTFAAASNAPANHESHSCFLIKSSTTLPDGQEATGSGTGFLIDKDLVLTCNHLVNIPTPMGILPADRVRVDTGKETYRARIVARDERHDLVLLKLNKPISSRRPLRMRNFDLQEKDQLSIIGNFPEEVRTTRGNLVLPSVRGGYAVSTAKVYSGFSGGPILDREGLVQGILSQRDDNYNSIFVRSDVVMDMLADYAKRNKRTIACMEPATDYEQAGADATIAESVSTGRNAEKGIADADVRETDAQGPAKQASLESAKPAESTGKLLAQEATAKIEGTNTGRSAVTATPGANAARKTAEDHMVVVAMPTRKAQ